MSASASRADPAQRLPGAGQHRPAHLVPVRAGHAPARRRRCGAGTGRAAPAGRPRRTRRCARRCSRASAAARRATAGVGQHQRRRVPVHRVAAGRRRTPRRPGQAGRVDGELAGRAAGRPVPAGSSGCRRPAAGSRWSPAACAPRPRTLPGVGAASTASRGDRAAAGPGLGRRPLSGSGRGSWVRYSRRAPLKALVWRRLVAHDVAGLRRVDHLAVAGVDADVADRVCSRRPGRRAAGRPTDDGRPDAAPAGVLRPRAA